MVDVTNKNLRALETLGHPTQHWDILIIYMMSKKLDSVTIREWEKFKNDLDTFPHLKQFIKFISNRADLLESLSHNNTHNIYKKYK